MSTVTLQEAQGRLPELITHLSSGEAIVITQDAQPVAQLTAYGARKLTPRFGSCKGMLTIVVDDDEHLKDFAEYMP